MEFIPSLSLSTYKFYHANLLLLRVEILIVIIVKYVLLFITSDSVSKHTVRVIVNPMLMVKWLKMFDRGRLPKTFL